MGWLSRISSLRASRFGGIPFFCPLFFSFMNSNWRDIPYKGTLLLCLVEIRDLTTLSGLNRAAYITLSSAAPPLQCFTITCSRFDLRSVKANIIKKISIASPTPW
jgi:hypothetical protein